MADCDETKAQPAASEPESEAGRDSGKAAREARLAEALRANLRRRKAARGKPA